MAHVDRYHNGVKLVSATELQSIIAKPFLDKWKIKLCQCKTHNGGNKSPFKDKELEALKKFGEGHCGFVHADYVKDNAGDLGTEVHSIIEGWFKGTLSPDYGNNEASTWARKIIDIYVAHNVKEYLIKAEDTLIDTNSNLAGSPDSIITFDGKPYIADIKIKNQLDDLTGMQGMAYRYLIKRKFNVDIPDMLILWAKKETKAKLVEPVKIDLREWEKPWQGLVQVWNTIYPKRKVTVHES